MRHRTSRNCVTVTATDPMTRHSCCFSQHMSYNRRIPAATLAVQSASPRFIEGGGAGVPAEHKATIALSTRDSLMCGAICRSATAMQRKEPADAAGPTSGQRYQADTQPGSQCRHECQQCVGQLTTVLLLCARRPRTTGPLWPDGLESTRCSPSPISLNAVLKSSIAWHVLPRLLKPVQSTARILLVGCCATL